MTIKEAIGKDIEVGNYLIGFQNEHQTNYRGDHDDETLFFARDLDDLCELWEEFCKENNLYPDCVDYVYVEDTAPSIIYKYLVETDACLFATAEGWCIDGGESGRKTFDDWANMLLWVDDENYKRNI